MLILVLAKMRSMVTKCSEVLWLGSRDYLVDEVPADIVLTLKFLETTFWSVIDMKVFFVYVFKLSFELNAYI